MNNALNAKLSKLVYSPAPEAADFFADKATFDRVLLLIRRLYHLLDTHEDLNRITLRFQYGKRYGLITLDAAPPQADSAQLRLKRWLVYSRLAERIIESGDDVSVALDDIATDGDAAAYADKVNQLIIRFRLYGSVALKPQRPAAPAAQHAAPTAELETAEAPKKTVQSIISRRGSSLSRINTQAKTEHYASAKTPTMKISRFSLGAYKSK